MTLEQLPNYLIIGSYLFGATSWLFMYRELKAMRRDLSDLKIEMTRESALRVGQDHEARLKRLEQAMISSAGKLIEG